VGQELMSRANVTIDGLSIDSAKRCLPSRNGLAINGARAERDIFKDSNRRREACPKANNTLSPLIEKSSN